MITEKQYNILYEFWYEMMHEICANVVADENACVEEHPLCEIMELAGTLVCESEYDN